MLYKMIRNDFRTLLLSFLCLYISESKSDTDCDKLGILLYEDIGCKPVKDGECPKRFDCNLAKPKSGCSFAGRQYAKGEHIDDKLTYSSCKVGCSCGTNPTGKEFNCAILDCPEWLGVPVDLGCHRKYEPDKCCSVGQVCPGDTDVEACQVDGKKYVEGERFYPSDKCLRCVCKKGFNGKLEEPFCKREVCTAQIDHSEELSNKCAVFYDKKKGEALCCPTGYVCPTSNEEIKEVSELNADLTCEFGSKILKKGEGFDTQFKEYFTPNPIEVQCECQLPPLVTCWKK